MVLTRVITDNIKYTKLFLFLKWYKHNSIVHESFTIFNYKSRSIVFVLFWSNLRFIPTMRLWCLKHKNYCHFAQKWSDHRSGVTNPHAATEHTTYIVRWKIVDQRLWSSIIGFNRTEDGAISLWQHLQAEGLKCNSNTLISKQFTTESKYSLCAFVSQSLKRFHYVLTCTTIFSKKIRVPFSIVYCPNYSPSWVHYSQTLTLSRMEEKNTYIFDILQFEVQFFQVVLGLLVLKLDNFGMLIHFLIQLFLLQMFFTFNNEPIALDTVFIYCYTSTKRRRRILKR